MSTPDGAGGQHAGRPDGPSPRNAKPAAPGETEYVPGLKPSDADYAGHEHADLVHAVKPIDASQVGEVSSAYGDLHQAFKEFSDQLNTAVGQSQGQWEGEAAADAQGFFSKLGKWAEGNAQNAKLASETMASQSRAAETAKNSMPEEVPFTWDGEMKKWSDNPFDLLDNMKSTFEKFQKSSEAQQQAAGVLKQYDQSLYDAASQQPVFADPPKFGDAGGGDKHIAEIPPEDKPPEHGQEKPGNGTTDPSGSDGGGSASSGGSAPGGGGGQAGGSHGGGSGGGSGTGGGYSSTPTPTPKSPGSTVGSAPVGQTSPAAYQPPSPTAAKPGGGGGMGGMGAVPMGGMGAAGGLAGAAGGAGYTSKIGKGGSGSSPNAGTGTAKPGGVGAAEAAAGRGAGGGRGAAGMAGAGRGAQGEEEDEHERASFLVEGDPDDVFGTDERTPPPVIGE